MVRRISLIFSLGAVIFVHSACTKVEKEYVKYTDTSYYQNVNRTPYSGKPQDRAVVKISIQDSSAGTGFFISNDGVLVTNNHVLGKDNCLREGCFIDIFQNYQIGSTHKKDPVFVKPLYVSESLDIAVYQIFHSRRGKRTLRKYIPQDFVSLTQKPSEHFIGQKAFTIGHPLGALKKYAEIDILEVYSDGRIEVGGAVVSGQSGSPIFGSDGEVIGVLRTSTVRFTNISNAGLNIRGGVVPVQTIREILEIKDGKVSIKNQNDSLISDLYSIKDQFITENWTSNMNYFYLAGALPETLKGPAEIAHFMSTSCEDYIDSIQDSGEPQGWEDSSSCDALISFISCSDKPMEGQISFCPSEKVREEYAQYFVKLFDYESERGVGFRPHYLEVAAALDKGLSYERLFSEKLQKYQPPLNGALANLILEVEFAMGLGAPIYQGVDIGQRLAQYKQDPNYRFNVPNIMTGIVLLGNNRYPGVNPRTTVFELLADPNVSVEDKLWLEEQAYKNHFL